jgi:hypothetical protein
MVAEQSPSGADLVRERHFHGVRVVELAARMGVTRQRVYLLEALLRVSPEATARYRTALAELAREAEAES